MTFRYPIIAAFFILSLLPAWAEAAPRQIALEEGRAETESRGVCLRLIELEGVMNNRLSSAKARYDTEQGLYVDTFVRDLERRNAEEMALRKQVDARLRSYVENIKQKSGTSLQKLQATAAFEDAITEALRAYRLEADAAQNTFRDGVRALARARSANVVAITGTFKTQNEQALARAKTECDKGVDPKAVREELHRTLAQIRDERVAALRDTSLVDAELLALVSVRKEAIRAAQEKFSVAANSASQTLRGMLY